VNLGTIDVDSDLLIASASPFDATNGTLDVSPTQTLTITAPDISLGPNSVLGGLTLNAGVVSIGELPSPGETLSIGGNLTFGSGAIVNMNIGSQNTLSVGGNFALGANGTLNMDNGEATKLNVGGNLNINSTTLNIDLGGTTPGIEHDQINVTGTAFISAALNLALINHEVPEPGRFYSLLTYGSRNGAFSPLNGTHPCPELNLSPFYTLSELDLLVSGSVTTECRCSLGGLQVTTSSLSPAILGISYSVQLQADCGTPPYSYEWDFDVEGLIGDANGFLSGTPTQAGSFNVRVQVRDAEGVISEKEWSLLVAATVPEPVLKLFKSSTATVPGREIDYFILVKNVGSVTATFSGAEFLEPWFIYISSDPSAEVIQEMPDFFSADRKSVV